MVIISPATTSRYLASELPGAGVGAGVGVGGSVGVGGVFSMGSKLLSVIFAQFSESREEKVDRTHT
jgi:hypothetical protein